jgi:regulator of cell morphogenesis and NO signaling
MNTQDDIDHFIFERFISYCEKNNRMMNRKILIEKLKDSNPFSSNTIDRWLKHEESKGEISDETIFFAHALDLFCTDPELPIGQLKSFPSSVILDYLTRTHNYYLNKRLPEVEQILMQLSSTPSEVFTTLTSVFGWMQKNMEKHFRIEERSLFPYIVAMGEVRNNERTREELIVEFKDFTVQGFIENHEDDVENKISEIKRYIIGSTNHCVEKLFPYRVLLLKLEQLEQDLRVHARIEDEVLVPLALKWEKEIFWQ